MKVHHVVNSYSLVAGGAERVVRSLHIGMPSMGIESSLVGIEAHETDDLSGALSLGLDTPYGLKALLGIRRYLLREVHPGDIVHAHMFPASFYIAILKLIGTIQVPTLVTEHSTHNRRRANYLGSLIDSILYRGFDRIVAISEGVREALVGWKPYTRAKISVVTNGVTPRFDSLLQRPPRETVIILSLGSLRSAKNYTTMIKSIALIADCDFEYWIAGEGDQKQALIQLVEQLGIGDKVRFLGFVEETSELLKRADIFLMASSWEGFGLAAIEAMNASLPVVLSNIPGLGELVSTEEGNGILVSPADEGAMAQALLRLLKSPELRRVMGEAGFRKSLAHTAESMCTGYADVYGGLG